MIYTSQGAMTPADLEEHRRDTDWYELNPPAPPDPDDFDCIDADGVEWPEHDFPDDGRPCTRCDAEQDVPDDNGPGWGVP